MWNMPIFLFSVVRCEGLYIRNSSINIVLEYMDEGSLKSVFPVFYSSL